MRTIKADKILVGEWEKKFLTLDDCKTVLDESFELIGQDGARKAMLVRGAISQENIATTWFHLKDYWPATTNRGTASGVSKIRVKADGTNSKTRVGEEVNSGVIGFYDRYPRIPFCRKCAWNQQYPEKFDTMIPLFQEVDAAFKKYWPEKYHVQAAVAEKTHKDFMIPGTTFTTVTVNKNYRTACHRDAQNLEGSISTMLVIHDGKIEGGELILPEYEVGVRFRSGDLIWFENTKLLHANAPIKLLRGSAQRCSMVFYFRDGMIHCGSHEDELKRAKSGLRTKS